MAPRCWYAEKWIWVALRETGMGRDNSRERCRKIGMSEQVRSNYGQRRSLSVIQEKIVDLTPDEEADAACSFSGCWYLYGSTRPPTMVRQVLRPLLGFYPVMEPK